MGAHYRHTTPEMAARVVTAIQARLTVLVHAAEDTAHAPRATGWTGSAGPGGAAAPPGRDHGQQPVGWNLGLVLAGNSTAPLAWTTTTSGVTDCSWTG